MPMDGRDEPRLCPVCGSKKISAHKPPDILQDTKMGFRLYRCEKGHSFMIEESDDQPHGATA